MTSLDNYDREYAEEVLSTAISGSTHHLAERLLAALEREEKLREAISDFLESVAKPSEKLHRLMAALAPEPHGNFEDTQDTNPEGGC